jgi:hypothetical protein
MLLAKTFDPPINRAPRVSLAHRYSGRLRFCRHVLTRSGFLRRTEHHPTVGGEELGESRLTELRGTHLAESTEHSCKVLLGLESTCHGYI